VCSEGLIGLERQLRAKEAGLCTHILVGIGSAMFMIVSKYGFDDILNQSHIILDPNRVAAQVVSGMGFFGAGTIIIQKQIVKGLTTAAGLWVTASIGLVIGGGLYEIGIYVTLFLSSSQSLDHRSSSYADFSAQAEKRAAGTDCAAERTHTHRTGVGA